VCASYFALARAHSSDILERGQISTFTDLDPTLQYELRILCPLPLFVQLFQSLSYTHGSISTNVAVSIKRPLKLAKRLNCPL
jgi:hypothetical protein